MIRAFRRILPLFIFLAVIAATLLPAEELDPALKEKADKALQAVDDTIMSLHSGICRITGKTLCPGAERVVDDGILLIFDYAAGNYRFENGNLRRVLLNPEFYYEVWYPGVPERLSVVRSSASDYIVSTSLCRVVDVQNLFMFVPVGPGQLFTYQKSDFHNHQRDIEKIAYEVRPSGFIKITTSVPKKNSATGDRMLTDYFINPREGYTVTHIDSRSDWNEDYTQHQIRDVTWENVNSTWVPTTYSMKQFIDEKLVLSVDWIIEWKQVNEKIDPKSFDLDEMLSDQKEGAVLFTTELGSDPFMLGRVEPGESFKKLQFQREELSWFRVVFLSVGIVFFVIGLCRRFIIPQSAKMFVNSGDHPPVS